MKGRRVYCKEGDVFPPMTEPGDYGQDKDGVWFCRPPRIGFPGGNLRNHQVTEHEDGTITVRPSILVMKGSETWHGWLTRGDWSEC